MGMIKKFIWIKVAVLLIVVAAIAGVAIALWPRGDDGGGYRKRTLEPARVKSLTEMARLCTMEIFEETGVNDTINGKGLFAIMRLKGSIGFDVDRLRIDSIGTDSLRVYLPAEKVELLESTEPGSYRVVDVWNIKYPLLPTNLTTSEENALKKRSVGRVADLAYRRGYVKRARAAAVDQLQKLYSTVPGVYVEVVDETPEGTRR